MSRQTISSPITLGNNEILLALQNKHNFVHRFPIALPVYRHCGHKIAVLKHARKKCFGGRQSSSTNIRTYPILRQYGPLLIGILQSCDLCKVVFDYLSFVDAYKMIYYISSAMYLDLYDALQPFTPTQILNRSLINAFHLYMGYYGLNASTFMDTITEYEGILAGEFPLAVFSGEFCTYRCVPSMDIRLYQNTRLLSSNRSLSFLESILRDANYKELVDVTTNQAAFLEMYNTETNTKIDVIPSYSRFCWQPEFHETVMATINFTCLKCSIERDPSSGKLTFYCGNLKDVFKKVVRMNDDIKYRFNHFIHNRDFENFIVPYLFKQIQLGYKINSSFFRLSPRCKRKLLRFKKKYWNIDFKADVLLHSYLV
jgi:hypothetical protein